MSDIDFESMYEDMPAHRRIPRKKEAFVSKFYEFTKKMGETMEKKNADYAGDSDPFKNFRGAEQLGMSVEQGILLRMQDKMSRLATLTLRSASTGEGPKVEDEKMADTLLDLANYAVILCVYLQFKSQSDGK